MISAELGKPLEQFIVELVATGRYGSKSEVLREGVRLIQEREARLAALDAAVARGLADADAVLRSFRRLPPKKSGGAWLTSDLRLAPAKRAEQASTPAS